MGITAEINLYVFVCMPDGEIVRAGRLLGRNLNHPGRREGFFQYDTVYLTHPGAFALDPVHLPLKDGVFNANRPETGLHFIFEDALPDAWGRRILAGKTGLSLDAHSPFHFLEALGGGGLGALIFSPDIQGASLEDFSIDFESLHSAMEEAVLAEQALTEYTEFKYLISGGSSAGGARPKVLVGLDGRHFIAKFPSVSDPHPEINVYLEALGLELGRRAGLVVPDFFQKRIGKKTVLLVERFDISPDSGRRALVSFWALSGVDEYPDFITYSDLATILRRHSSNPRQDLELLFKQMVLNILICNSDDHLKNFYMIRTGNGWRLSPAYDLVPNIWRFEQLLKVGGRHGDLTVEDVLGEAKAFGIGHKRARILMAETAETVRDNFYRLWNDRIARIRIPALERLKSEITRRINRFTHTS